jgi:predicted RNase H-like HicB family nuclease
LNSLESGFFNSLLTKDQVRGLIIKYRLAGEGNENNCKYEIIIDWSEEDRAYIAEVPELPGCEADGKTYRQALANVEVIIQEWLETAKQLKRDISQPKGRLYQLDTQACPLPQLCRKCRSWVDCT